MINQHRKEFTILLMAVFNDSMWMDHEEMGICYIGSFLREKGYKVVIKSITVSKIDYSQLAEYGPDMIGMPVYDVNKADVYGICGEIRSYLPNIRVILGGSVPTCYGNRVLEECPDADFAIAGEGEVPFYELAHHLEQELDVSDIKNLIYRNGEKIIANPANTYVEDIDSIPFAARDILSEHNIKIAQLSTSRGCTAHCSFCAAKLYHKRWNGRSAKHIVDEIEYMADTYGIRAFNIIDGSFEDPGINSGRLYEFASEIIRRKLIISYYAHFRAESFRKMGSELLKLLKQSGLVTVCIGLESGNPEDLKLYNKNANYEDMIYALQLLRNLDINVDPGFINFNPYSTVDRLSSNIRLLEKWGFAGNLDYIIKSTRIYEETALYEKVNKDGLLMDCDENERCFRFLTPVIRDVYNYVYGYLKGNDPVDITIFRTICHGASFYRVGVSCMKHLFEKEGYDAALNVLTQYENANREVNKYVNTNVSRWFLAILDLAEKGWDTEQADHISEEILSKETLKDVARQYLYLNLKQAVELSKHKIDTQVEELKNFIFK